jgi:23S rRNA (guanosine2251-2'-O)-methyltransferase
VARRCDGLVQIPQRGQVASLNVSVAGALLLYEAMRQRRTQAAPVGSRGRG